MTPAERTELRLFSLYGAYKSYGYVVTADPIPGEEETFMRTLREGLLEIAHHMTANARSYGTRGKSKKALANLHRTLPEPVWGVEVAA
jgi:hypothetical protein